MHQFEVHRVAVPGTAIKITAIPCGAIQLKKSHVNPSLGGMPQILADWRWTNSLPIYCWLIEHPEGYILVDTGGRTAAQSKDYYRCDPISGRINHQILKFDLDLRMEIDQRLMALGIQTDQIKKVVLTHLHLDHVDGLHHFKEAEVFVSKIEKKNPYGAIPCLWPSWFEPRLIEYRDDFNHYFPKAYALSKDEKIWILPTPGHTFGHQSVLVRGAGVNYLLAGDMSFTDQQLQEGQVAGINADKKLSLQSYQKVKAFAKNVGMVYLPSHDLNLIARLKSTELLF